MLSLLDIYLGRLPLVPQKEVLFCDVECYRGLFYVAFKRRSDGRRRGFEFSHRSPLDRKRVSRIMRQNTIVTFNGASYDIPIIYLALTGATNEELKVASNRIIKGGIKWWDVERELGISIPKIDHIDLIEPNPAVMQSLKILNGRLHGKRLQDLPYDPETDLTDDEMDVVIDYCLHSDLDATENLFNALREPLELRDALGQQYKMDFRSKSDAQMGEGIIKSRVQKLTGKRIEKDPPKPGTSFRYKVPRWMEFESEQLRSIVETVRKTDFIIKADGKVDFPKAFEKFNITLGSSTYKMGIGGLHSTEANRSAHSDSETVLIDADVASQYPAIIMKLGLYPKALGREFLTVYGGLIQDRLIAKQRGKAIDDELKAPGLDPAQTAALDAEKDRMKARDKGGKIALNGSYGKLGSRYSVLYAPHLMISVTLTGQLSLLMLIERAEAAGIPVISGNTDGVVFACPRSMIDGLDGDRITGGRLKEITDWWQSVTGFKLEFAEYRSIYNQSVNSYIALKADGKVKRKGPIGNPWSERKEENDLRAQMMKNPQMTICSDAVLEHILTGKPVAETIRESRDIRGFVTLINATGGATWRDAYLGKVVRYIWSTDGDPIIKVKAHEKTGNRPKVPKTDGCRPVMTLPDDFPDDIDYGRYIAEANKILAEIGFEGRKTDTWRKLLLDLVNQHMVE